jgi:hypothetical protein
VGFAAAGLDRLRRVSHAVDGATVNDAVLTVVAGGLADPTLLTDVDQLAPASKARPPASPRDG